MQIYYFTRTGRSKKVAMELAERYGTKAEEIVDGIDWQGASGYIKAGYKAFKGDALPAEYKKPSAGEDIILVFPVWAGTFPPAVRTFLEKESRTHVICLPTSIGSKLKDREGFIKVIDVVGKTIVTPKNIC